MDLSDPIVLARIQFAFTGSFHIIFPAFSIGLASFLAVLNGTVRLNAKGSERAQPRNSSGHAKVPPFGQSSGSAILECLPADEGALRVDVDVDPITFL